MQQAEFSHKAAPLTAYSTSVGDMVPGGVLLAAAPTKIAASVDPSATSKHSPVFSHSHDFSQPSTIAGSHMNRQLFDERPEWKSEAFPLIPLAPVTSVYTKKVCDAFLDKYYSILYTTPDKAFQFYQDSSRLSRPEQKSVPNSVTTLQGIYEKILSFHSDSMMAEVELVDVQELYDGEISIHVTGCLSRYDYSERKITQSFLLAPQVGGYFILQDVIRYVDEHDPREATSVPAIPSITADSDIEVELQYEEGSMNNDEFALTVASTDFPLDGSRSLPINSSEEIELECEQGNKSPVADIVDSAAEVDVRKATVDSGDDGSTADDNGVKLEYDASTIPFVANEERSINKDDDCDLEEKNGPKKILKKTKRWKRKVVGYSDSDSVDSGSSDYENTVSKEEREFLREARSHLTLTTTRLRSSSLPHDVPVDRGLEVQKKICLGRKGKSKAEESQVDMGKQVCGICLSEERNGIVRGPLNCCTPYFCFTCIMEWSKMESLFLFTAPLSAKSAKMFSLNLKLSLEEDKGEERGSLDTPLDSEDGAAGSKSNIERAVRVFSKKVSGLSQKVGCNNKPENTAKFPLFRRREYIFVISVDSHPAQDLLGQLTRIFEIARSDKVPGSVGFIPSTALTNSAVHSLIVFGRMSVTKFDAFICNNDYHSQIKYLCCGGGFRKTLGRWAASTVRKQNRSEEQVVNTDEQRCSNFCYAFNEKNPSVPPVQEPRKMLRIQALRCHVIYNWNGTRLHFIPVLASKSPALRNVYAGWGVARRGVIDIAAEATKLEQPMVLDLTTYGINGVVGVFPQSEIQYEVPGMVLSDFRGIARKNMGAAVVDCGIDILVYFTDLQRRAVVSTATITCLHPLRLIHVTTATVLAYGIYKTDLPENVAFVSVDHASTQVCIAGLKKVQLKIPAHAFDWSLGGRDCDEVMFKYFASKFKEKSKIDVYQTAGACIWLWVACEKLQKATTECFVPMAGLLFQIGFQKAGHSSMVPRDMGCYVTIAIGKWGMVSRLLQLLIDLGLPLKRACGWIVVRYNAHAFGAMYVADFLSCTTDDNIEVLFHVSVQGGIIWPP